MLSYISEDSVYALRSWSILIEVMINNNSLSLHSTPHKINSMVSSKEDPHKLLGAGCDKWGDQRLALALVIQKWIEERGLTWFIDGGTLLGAWRNEKFIAHDDDFDIALIMDGDEPVCDLGHMCDSLLAALPSPYMCRIVSSYSDKVEVFDPTQGKYKLTGAQYHGADFHYVTVDL